MSTVWVDKISRAEPPSELIAAVQLDRPTRDTRCEAPVIEVAGWIVGCSSEPLTLNVLHRGRRIRALPVQLPRPDVLSRYEGRPGAGFAGLVSVLALPRRFQIELVVVMKDGQRIPVATVHGRRELLSPDVELSLQPVMLTTLGRTGSTWMMNLLSRHPQIIIRAEYPFESKVAKYWLQTLKTLSEPTAQPFNGPRVHVDRWWIGPNPYFALSMFHEQQPGSALAVESLAEFCMQRINAWYANMGSEQLKPMARYYSEKFEPNHLPPLARELYPAAKEVFLVRDPRDWVCSILAFDEKRGFYGFGRESEESTEEYVQRLKGRVMMLHEEWRSRSKGSLLVRYENLIGDCEGTLRSLLKYLDLDASPPTLKGMIEDAKAQSREYQLHRTSSDGRGSIGRWTRLEPSMRELIISVLSDSADRLGYRGSRQTTAARQG